MADQATTLDQFQRWWASLGDDMRRKAGQSTTENMREQLPTALMGLSAIAPGARMMAGGAIRPGANATFDQTTLAPALRADYMNGTPAEQAEIMRIWQSLHRPAATGPTPTAEQSVRLRARTTAEQAQRDYYSRLQGVGPPRSALPPPAPRIEVGSPPARGQTPEYIQGLTDFRTAQPPPRSQMHSIGGVAAGSAAYPYADDDLDMWWSRLPQP